ncbi:MAG: hypothetical protein SGBAC_006631 [Bacillariaceae sp.]
MATEVEIDPSFQLRPDPKPAANLDVPYTKGHDYSSGTRKSPKKKGLMGVFKKKKSSQYETLEDTPSPPTAPSTPEVHEDLEIDLTVNVVSAKEDPALGFDADDNDNLMAMDVPDIVPHEQRSMATGDDQNQIVRPAQFKVPTQFEPELEVVLDDATDKLQQDENEEARKHLEAAHQQIGLAPAHTNDLAKNDAMFCTPMNGFYEEPKAQPTTNGLEAAEPSQDPALQATKQRAVITTSGQASNPTAEEYARHENFEVVLDPSYYDSKGKEGAKANLAAPPPVDEAVLEIQRDLEGFEREMKSKEQSKEEKQPGTHVESKQEAPFDPPSPDKVPAASPSRTEAGSEDSPMGEIEVLVEKPPEVKISVETQPAAQETKPKKEKKSRKMKLGNLTKKVKAMSSRASVKASKVLKSVPIPVSPSNNKEKQEPRPSALPEKTSKPKAVWRAVEDPKSGKVYYYHRTTRETTWTKPKEQIEFERAMAKYERDRIAAEKYDHKPFEELVIDTGNTADDQQSTDGDALSEEVEEKKEDNDSNKVGFNIVESLEEEPFDEEPFDERAAEPKPFDEGYDDPRPLPSLAAQGRVASHFSTMTEKTQRINNVSSGLDMLDEDNQELESQHSFHSATTRPIAPRCTSRVPSSHRTRELRVEDLGSSRISAETFDRRGRVVKGREPYSNDANDERTSFPEQRPADSFDNDDPVSAPNDMDLDYNMRRDNFNNARHRALDDAIERKDGNLFEALVSGMKASDHGMQHTYAGWNQSEVDKLIARDDWDGVQSYVSTMRDIKSAPQSMPHPPITVATARVDKSSPDEAASLHTDYSA